MLLISYCCNLYIVLKVMIHVVTDKMLKIILSVTVVWCVHVY